MVIQNSNLPPCFVNEIVKIVEDETIVRSNFKSVSDVYSWIEEYGRTSDTKLNLRSSRPSRTKLVCWLHEGDGFVVGAVRLVNDQPRKMDWLLAQNGLDRSPCECEYPA
ncbi:hypothetical protein AVEN_262186-1 [Araneus ventricosus]|uniref:Uncharacterized protein n=1 Tax=Araneus ventricosus TaxID=182803 RepID=A0A4Y2URA8_ARAVE|nr:hypothetical protein AVEN_262186-1 [Araneus ventricosus]